MQQHKTRLTMVTGATLALLVAGTAAVAANGPRDDDRGFGFGQGRARFEAGWDDLGTRAQLRAGVMGQLEDFERREVITQTADGTSALRVEQGVVESVSDSSLQFSLGSGESVSVTLDDDTDVIGVELETVTMRGWSRERMVPSQIEPTELTAGDSVLVWSDSEDGGAFVASRIVLQPADDAADTEAADEATDEPADDAGSEETAATDA